MVETIEDAPADEKKTAIDALEDLANLTVAEGKLEDILGEQLPQNEKRTPRKTGNEQIDSQAKRGNKSPEEFT